MILVVGATGNLGGAIARRLLERQEKVRVLVRSGSPYDDLVEAGAQPAIGDLKDPASLRQACSGVDAVVTTANSMARGGSDTVTSVDRRGNRDLVDAAAAERVRHFVFVSALGATPDSPSDFLRAKGETEQRLTESGIGFTILQPNLYMDLLPAMVVGAPALAGEPVTLLGEGRRQHSMVAMRDVVEYAVAGLDRGEARNKRLVIGGPQPVSWRDIVAAFERELGRDIEVRTVPLGGHVPGLPPQVNDLLHGLELYDSAIDMTDLAATYGITPTPLAEVVGRFVAAVQ